MKIPHDKFCVLPWVSLEASPIGTVRPCCLADHEIVDDAGNKVHLNRMNFTDIRNTQHMQSLRKQFLAGERPDTCRRCWAEEDSGRTSKRMHTLDRLKHMVRDVEWTADAKPLMFLDLKLGNICNLKCRICGSWSSSTFAVEELAHVDSQDRKTSFHYTMLREGRWPRESAEFWQELENNLEEIRYLEFTGGEPFMIDEHFDLLRKLVDRGLAGQIEIHYNTNGTIFPAHAEDIWRAFKHVEIAFSIDDVGNRFEYQRSGAKWADVNTNIKLFQNMRDRNRNMSLQICCTVNVFNVLYLDQVAAWINQQDVNYVYWNMLHDAPYFSIATLPESAKTAIADHLHRSEFPARWHRDRDQVIEFMMNGTSQDGKLLLQMIKQLDIRRDQALMMVAPELAELIHYYEKA